MHNVCDVCGRRSSVRPQNQSRPQCDQAPLDLNLQSVGRSSRAPPSDARLHVLHSQRQDSESSIVARPPHSFGWFFAIVASFSAD